MYHRAIDTNSIYKATKLKFNHKNTKKRREKKKGDALEHLKC